LLEALEAKEIPFAFIVILFLPGILFGTIADKAESYRGWSGWLNALFLKKKAG
jgi:hypothetical protein